MNTFLPHLERLLQLAKMQDDDMLDTLRELAYKFDVSHMTIKRDLKLLPKVKKQIEDYKIKAIGKQFYCQSKWEHAVIKAISPESGHAESVGSADGVRS